MLSFLGFTTGGIAAASVASAWRSSLGNVATGSLFASLQSLGATDSTLPWLAVAVVPLILVEGRRSAQSARSAYLQPVG